MAWSFTAQAQVHTSCHTRLSLGHLPKGIYLIRYELESQAAVRKVVVE